MSAYRKEGTFEKPYLTMNGIAMLLMLIALGLVEAFVIVSVRNPVFIIAVGVVIAFMDFLKRDFAHIQVGIFLFAVGYALVKISSRITEILISENFQSH